MPILQLLSLTVPIFLLIGLGAFSVRAGWFPEKQAQGLAAFVLNYALPALVLGALAGQDLEKTFDWRYVAAYGCGSLAAFLAAFAGIRFLLARPLTAAALGGLGGATSNTGFIGFPVASLAFGSAALVAMPLNMLVENILIIPLALALAEAGRQGGAPLGATLAATARRLWRPAKGLLTSWTTSGKTQNSPRRAGSRTPRTVHSESAAAVATAFGTTHIGQRDARRSAFGSAVL